MATYWTEFTYRFQYFDQDSQSWEHEEDSQAMRFHCPKKELRREVRSWVEKELASSYGQYRYLDIFMTDYYLTTQDEV